MKKKTNIRTLIRTIVREEVAMAIHEVITELKQPSLSSKKLSKPKPKKKIADVYTAPFNSHHHFIEDNVGKIIDFSDIQAETEIDITEEE